MTDDAYFFDTYAVMEVAQGSESYRPYTSCEAFICVLNLFEMYYSACRRWGLEAADKLMELYRESAVAFGEDVVKEGALMRLRHFRLNLSMADCIGYVLARRLRVKFLTGDRQFEGMPNVEFVK